MTLDINTIIMILLIAGAINWGAIAYNNTDFVSKIGNLKYERYVKYTIGAAGVYALYQFISHNF